jgi:hypothetical protein
VVNGTGGRSGKFVFGTVDTSLIMLISTWPSQIGDGSASYFPATVCVKRTAAFGKPIQSAGKFMHATDRMLSGGMAQSAFKMEAGDDGLASENSFRLNKF